MATYEQECQTATDAARDAARLCLNVRREMAVKPDSMIKAGREPVTVADFGAQAIILRAIAQRFPDDCVVAEERASDFAEVAIESQQRQVAEHVSQILARTVSPHEVAEWLEFGRGRSGKRVWAVDPIDGTKGFLRGDQFAIAIALLVKGQAAVGVLACPLFPFESTQPTQEGSMAVAVWNEGSHLQSLANDRQRPLRASTNPEIGAARVVESVETGHSNHRFSSDILASAGVGGNPVRIDSQAKYMAVADGRAEIYMRHSPTENYAEKIWDHAAGSLVVSEAGGRVTDLDGKPLDFSSGEHLSGNRGVLATNKLVHDRLLETIRSYQPS